MHARVSQAFVGRSSDLALLHRALAELPRAVLLGGEAGLGKSRLIREFTTRAQAGGARVLTGGCLELASDGLPFAPFTAVLRALVRELGTDGVGDLLHGVSTGGLARMLPEFGEPDDEATGETRARLFELVLTLLERLAEREPVVLVIEDAHWADKSSRDLLVFLVRNLDPGARLLILVSYRTDELHRDHPLRPLLTQLHRVELVHQHELVPLSRAETAELARDILGEQPHVRLLDSVYERAQGNPLFTEALLGCDGRLPGEPPREIPESLRDLLLSQVHKLPEDTQELLRVASVSGIRVEHPLLTTVACLDDARVSRLLRPAVAANVLTVDGDGYLFRHALIREAVHDDLLPGEHNRLHARYAQALDDDPSLMPSGRRVVAMAHHWYAAHNTTWALIGAWRAAEEAARAVAHAESLDMLSRVLELWEQVPDAAERIGRDHTEVMEKAVTAASLAGEFERGIRFATAALTELAPGFRQPGADHRAGHRAGLGAFGIPGLADAQRADAQRADAQRADTDGRGAESGGADPAVADPARIAWLLEQRGRMSLELTREEGLKDLRTAARLIPSDPPTADRARVLAALAKELYFSRRMVEAREVSAEALHVARQVDDPLAEGSTTLTMICIDAGTRDFDVRLADLQRIERMTRPSANYQMSLRLAINFSDTLEGMGAHERAAEVARRGIADARRHGVERITGTFLAANLAEPLVSLGRWDEALSVLEHALQQEPPLVSRSYLHVMVGEVKLARGDLGGAAAEAFAAREIVGSHGFKGAQDLFAVIRLEAAMRLAEGDLDELLTVIEPALHAFDMPDDPRYAWPVLVYGAAGCADGLQRTPAVAHARAFGRAWARAATGGLGEHGPARRGAAGDGRTAALLEAVFGAIEERAEKLTVHGPVQEAHRLTFLAEAARVRGHLDCDAWDTAAAAWRNIGQPYPEARARWRAAEARIRAGDRQGAAERLRRATELAEGLRAVPLRGAIGDLARRGRIDSGDPADRAVVAALTPREWEVLRLVADGRSNREIATALFISAKTASVHVSNILGKLGVGGRGEAAAAAHRMGLFETVSERAQSTHVG